MDNPISVQGGCLPSIIQRQTCCSPLIIEGAMQYNGQSNQCARWMFTINNPETDVLFAALPEGARYVCWQREVGDQGTPHLQGYIAFARSWNRKRVSALFPRAWLGAARGTEQQAVDYCTKADTRVAGPWEFGERKTQGERVDLKPLQAATAAIVAGESLRSVDPYVFVKHANGLKALSALQAPPRRDNLVVTCIVGGTGVGKTHWVFEHFPNTFRPHYGNCGLWWDGYAGEDSILLDEYRGQCPLQKLLMILDKYPLMLEIKGGMVAARFTKVFITTNSEPEVWYSGAAFSHRTEFAALTRRLGRCDMSLYPDTHSHWVKVPEGMDARAEMQRLLGVVWPLTAPFVVAPPLSPTVPLPEPPLPALPRCPSVEIVYPTNQPPPTPPDVHLESPWYKADAQTRLDAYFGSSYGIDGCDELFDKFG
nr:MAG TPA: Putative viral replication protein [Cressdnaviricota sp.]